MKRFLVVAMVAAAMAVMAPKAEAALLPIGGGLSMGVVATPTGPYGSLCGTQTTYGTGCNDWGNATGVAFGSPITTSNASGDFLTLGVGGNLVSFNNFAFNLTTNTLTPAQVTPLWSFLFNGRTYSFDLTALLGGSQFSTRSLGCSVCSPAFSSLTLFGTGILNVTGYAATPAAFSFSSTDNNGVFQFSIGNQSTASVPEPGTMVLFGTGLLGLAAIARRRLMKQ